MLGLSTRIASLWPPGPYPLASAAARVVEGIVNGGRGRLSCFVALPSGRVAAMPVELGPGGVHRMHEPVLTRQERTLFESAVEKTPDAISSPAIRRYVATHQHLVDGREVTIPTQRGADGVIRLPAIDRGPFACVEIVVPGVARTAVLRDVRITPDPATVRLVRPTD